MARTLFDGEIKVVDKVKPRKVKRNTAIKKAAEKAYKGIKEERFAFGDQRSDYEKNLSILKENPLIAWTDNPWIDLTKPETINEVHHYIEFNDLIDDGIYVRFLDEKTRGFLFLIKDEASLADLESKLIIMARHLHGMRERLKKYSKAK